MIGSIIVVGFFLLGCLLGWAGVLPSWIMDSDLSMYVLYALMFQVGLSIGSDKKLKDILRSIRLKLLLVPLATISGSLLFAALISLVISRWSIFDCLAVGSGFAYYSGYPAERAFFRRSDRFRIRDHRLNLQYYPGDFRPVGCTFLPEILRASGTNLCRRCHHHGYNAAHHHPILRQRPGVCFYLPRDSGRFQRTFFSILLLPVITKSSRFYVKSFYFLSFHPGDSIVPPR